MSASKINRLIVEKEVNDICMLNINFEEEIFNGEEPLAVFKWLSKDVEIKYKDKILTIISPVLYTDKTIIKDFQE